SGQSVTLTTTVSASDPGSGTPTGTVFFLEDSTTLGTGTLSAGQASLTTSNWAAGTDALSVVYSGDDDFSGGTSSTLNETVQDSTITTLLSSVNPAVYGQSVTLTATVSAGDSEAGTSTGTVAFLDGSMTLGTGSLSGGQTSLTI